MLCPRRRIWVLSLSVNNKRLIAIQCNDYKAMYTSLKPHCRPNNGYLQKPKPVLVSKNWIQHRFHLSVNCSVFCWFTTIVSFSHRPCTHNCHTFIVRCMILSDGCRRWCPKWRNVSGQVVRPQRLASHDSKDSNKAWAWQSPQTRVCLLYWSSSCWHNWR